MDVKSRKTRTQSNVYRAQSGIVIFACTFYPYEIGILRGWVMHNGLKASKNAKTFKVS